MSSTSESLSSSSNEPPVATHEAASFISTTDDAIGSAEASQSADQVSTIANESEQSAIKATPVPEAILYPHTATLEECLFQSDTVSLAALRRLSSSGIHDLVGQEQHQQYSWRGLTWRLLLGYLPGAIETSTTQSDERCDWRAELQAKRQEYFDLVQTLFQSNYDATHGIELLDDYDATSSDDAVDYLVSSLSNLSTDSNECQEDSKSSNSNITPAAKEIWKKTGRDVHILEALTRGLNAIVISNPLTCPETDNADSTSDDNDAPPAMIRSALLLDEIRKDVVRTHPDLAFFLHPRLGRRRYAALERILVCACWPQPSTIQQATPYVQGMNEIAATLYYVLATTTTTRVTRENTTTDTFSSLAQEDWAANAEADTYWLFRILLEEIHAVYNRNMDHDESGIRGRLAAMENLLTKHDPQVMEHLMEHGLDASFFAIRWWTTLLSREFLLPDTMRLWDSMFASTHKDNFLRYACVTMVMTVRDRLLKGDFSTCLRLLQSFPSTHMDQLLQSTRALWIYESQITVACHKGGIGLHQALETIAPPPAIIMAFGLKAGSVQQHNQMQHQQPTVQDIAAEKVRDVAAHANVWLGRAKNSLVQWNKNRSRSTGELGQPTTPLQKASTHIDSTQSLDRTTGKALAAQALSLRRNRSASAVPAAIPESGSFEDTIDDVYLQAIQNPPPIPSSETLVNTSLE
ncbi:hypothetical protein MPSEU_000465300 [Mayamaea pseudoterrestris]|nr:hypothetical protein MPSEU_000465300 [Mayamaea pseudoterrestris]